MKQPAQKAVVLGAGISGLAAAHALQDGGFATDVLEACPSIGGLTRSVQVGAFCFDYTGHLLHLARYASPAGIPYADLHDADWQRIDRRSFCYLGERLVTAPVQYNLRQLPPELFRACVASYDARPPLPPGEPSFRDFVISGFGQLLSDEFLIPQNEKTMATSLERLSHKAVRRFFPPPDEPRVRAGIAGDAPPAPEYNSQFWYPRLGGIEALVHGLARGVRRLHRLQRADRVDLTGRRVRTQSGDEWEWDVLLSSIPLRDLCLISGDAELREWSRALTHSTTISLNIGIRGALPPALDGVHWIYVPDRAIPFYRVGVYSNISAGLCPPDCASLYVEVGVPGEAADQVDIAGDLQPRVLAALRDLGWLRLESVVCVVTHVMRCAYVHHTPERDAVVAKILARLKEYGVHPIGRYGLWDYTSMEDSIASGIATAQSLAS